MINNCLVNCKQWFNKLSLNEKIVKIGLGGAMWSGEELEELRRSLAELVGAERSSLELGIVWWSQMELGGPQQSSASSTVLGGAQPSPAELVGVRRSSVDRGKARQSTAELVEARHSSAELEGARYTKKSLCPISGKKCLNVMLKSKIPNSG